MADFTSFRSIIELWPSREAMAADLPGATGTQISKWWQRDSIPADWWASVLETDLATSAGVTADILTALAARHPTNQPADHGDQQDDAGADQRAAANDVQAHEVTS